MRRVALGELAEINPRLSKGAIDSDHLVSFVPMAAVSELSKSIVETKAKPYGEVSKGYTYFDNGDLIVAKITPCYENGKMALAEGLAHSPAFGSTEFHVIRPGERLLGRFLFHLLQSPAVRVSGKSRMKGAAGQKRVPPDFFKELKVPCPSLPEQKRIAAILDAADALRAKRRETLAQLDTLLQSTFLEMFGDPATNSRGWKIRTIGEFAQVGTGSTPSRKEPNNFNGEIPWVKSTEIDWKEIDGTSESVSELGRKVARLKLYPKGSVVLALYGQGKTRGKCGILGVDATINQACCALTAENEASNIFLFSYLKQSYSRLRGESRGGNQENLNLSIVRNFPIPAPPFEHRDRFASIVQSAEQQKSRLRAHLDELNTLFASLQARAFAGEL